VHRKFKELKGNDIFMTETGLIGLQTPDDYLSIIKKNKVIKKCKLNPDFLLIGFSEDASIYYVKPTNNKEQMEIRRVRSNGKILTKVIGYNFTLTCDPMSYLQVIDVTSDGEVVLMDFDDNNKKINVSMVNL
jgi:hypothetical protein